MSPPVEPPPAGGETICLGNLQGVVVDKLRVPPGAFCGLSDTTVTGNAIAEPGATLSFGVGTRVGGNVEAQNGSTLTAVETVVDGRVTCLGCRLETFALETRGSLKVQGASSSFFVTWSTIGGNVEITGSSGGARGLLVADSSIAGNLRLETNIGPVRVLSNTVRGTVQFVQNDLGPPECTIFGCPPQHTLRGNSVRGNMQVLENTGVLEIAVNTIGRALQCTGNMPQPTVVGNAARSASGQCASP